jgi:glutamate-1-semialdehyde aminotransferase
MMPTTLMQSVVSELQKERKRLADELHRVTAALTAFGNVYMRGSQSKAAVATRKKRTISAAGRKRIAAAQRARWAKIKGQKVVLISSRKGRTMSPAARKRIVAAQKARWAKWRKARKKA